MNTESKEVNFVLFSKLNDRRQDIITRAFDDELDEFDHRIFGFLFESESMFGVIANNDDLSSMAH